jgi:hypothetical protein
MKTELTYLPMGKIIILFLHLIPSLANSDGRAIYGRKVGFQAKQVASNLKRPKKKAKLLLEPRKEVSPESIAGISQLFGCHGSCASTA